MIPFDVEYLRPESIQEACDGYASMQENETRAIYYAGGTEVVTFGRSGKTQPEAIIDLKHIPECLELKEVEDELIFGAALPLNTIVESDAFPLFGQVAQGIADHSVRNRLTLGGNLAGRLSYRETALPLLLVDASVHLAGATGQRAVQFQEIFHKGLLLKEGEFVTQIRVSKKLASAPVFYQRKTRHSRIDYPIVSAAFLKYNGGMRMAIGGAFYAPLRKEEAETVLNDSSLAFAKRAAKVVDVLGGKIAHDRRASSEYRRALLEGIIHEAIKWSDKVVE